MDAITNGGMRIFKQFKKAWGKPAIKHNNQIFYKIA